MHVDKQHLLFSIAITTNQQTLWRTEDFGERWNIVQDKHIDLSRISQVAMELTLTKQYIVSVIGRFFDPFGHLAPIVIRFKVLFQALCETKLEWDQKIIGELLSKWHALVSDI